MFSFCGSIILDAEKPHKKKSHTVTCEFSKDRNVYFISMVFKENGNIFSTGKPDGFTSTQRKDSTLKGKVKCETESTLKVKVKL